jgi:hypothetical protein
MSTAPSVAPADAAAPSERVEGTTAGQSADRIHQLEAEVAELRDTLARFANIMIGEVKDLRQSKPELPPLPSGVVGTPADAPTAQPTRRPWLLTEFFRDIGAAMRMYFDPRYRVRRSTQLLVPVILAFFVLNALFFRTVFTVPILSMILEKIGDIVLAILL